MKNEKSLSEKIAYLQAYEEMFRSDGDYSKDTAFVKFEDVKEKIQKAQKRLKVLVLKHYGETSFDYQPTGEGVDIFNNPILMKIDKIFKEEFGSKLVEGKSAPKVLD